MDALIEKKADNGKPSLARAISDLEIQIQRAIQQEFEALPKNQENIDNLDSALNLLSRLQTDFVNYEESGSLNLNWTKGFIKTHAKFK